MKRKGYSAINFILTCFVLTSSVACGLRFTSSTSSSKDSLDQRIAAMSLEEKVGQTCQITLDVLLESNQNGPISPARIDTLKLQEALLEYKVGSILNVGSHTFSMEEWKGIIQAINKPYFSGKTSIPILYGIDAIHGMNYTQGATLFPQEIGLAATWNRNLVRDAAAITAYEVRASGIPWNFSPVLDLGRQPLWSRTFETLGEDPYLCAELGKAFIVGYQGMDSIGPTKVAACMKHFVGYSATQSGRDRTPAWIPEKYMRELYLPSFKAAVEQGAQTVMVNSGVVNGIPGHINYHLLTEVLKGEYHFDGFAVSDWEDFIMLHTVHRTSETLEKAYISAFNAGVDMSMVPSSPFYKEYCKILINAVKSGDVSMVRLDDAVKRILRVKQRLGLMDDLSHTSYVYSDFGSLSHKRKALDAAIESITLLKNEGNVLPLKPSEKILIAGPTANNLIYLNGAWTHTWQGQDTTFNTKGCNTILQAFVSYLGKDKVIYSPGAELYLQDGFEKTRLVQTEDYQRQLEMCDKVILCLGELPSTEKPGDIHSLNLDVEQLELVRMAEKAGKPVVLVLLEGRPRIIEPIVPYSEAIVQCYLPGDYGSEALVKLLFGEENFSGKLPYTYPRYDGVIEFYDHPLSVDRSKSGAFDAYMPQWDFGFGLSYSTVEYKDLELSASNLSMKDTLTIKVSIQNTGKMPVKEVVQVYLTDEYASLVPAGKRLKRFEKVDLKPGESKQIQFYLTSEDCSFYTNQEEKIIEPGSFVVGINHLSKSFKLILP